MARNPRSGHAQHFEHAIATAITCRSVIKYNSSLNEEQKAELLSDIDASVQFLQEQLVMSASIKKPLAQAFPPLSIEEIIAISQVRADDEEANEGESETDDSSLLQGLYRLYNALLKKKDGNGIELFVSRYNQVMSMLGDIQLKIEKDMPAFLNSFTIGDNIDRVRGFVTDLYCMFTEFASALAGILEGREIYIDTEKVSSPQQVSPQGSFASIDDLLKVYQAHARIKRRKGALESHVADASALLIFLEEHLDQRLEKRDEVISQLKNVINLLNDLSHLVIEYERSTGRLLQQVNDAQA